MQREETSPLYLHSGTILFICLYNIRINYIILLFAYFFSIHAGSANDASGLTQQTGQTQSYATGDDGQIQKGIPFSDQRFTDNLNGTVTDNLTRLVWMKNANCWGMQSWSNALSKVAGLNAAAETCTGYTSGSHTDWRLPNIREMHSLVDRGRENPALPSNHPFSGVQSAVYWSATTTNQNIFYAFSVEFYTGYSLMYSKSDVRYVWPVRGGQ
ncbi:MAG: DUF1566 domain-containing protein [Magnetococcales bacterium]|nr:DUF1566 domain-containing protein [Magnetococcales bacterium]